MITEVHVSGIFKAINLIREKRIKIHAHALKCELLHNFENNYNKNQLLHARSVVLLIADIADKHPRKISMKLENRATKLQLNVLSYHTAKLSVNIWNRN